MDLFVAGAGTGGTLFGVGGAQGVGPCRHRGTCGTGRSSHSFRRKTGSASHSGNRRQFDTEKLRPSVIDEIIRVTGDETFATSRAVAREEGVVVGIYSGAVLHANGAFQAAGKRWETYSGAFAGYRGALPV